MLYLHSLFTNSKDSMQEIKLHLPIGAENENKWMAMWGEEDVVFSLETLQRIFKATPQETDYQFNIHCDGGSVYEGLAIYDALRTSGKNIHMNIEGGCHSMAVTLLLAAPKEYRTANANARALIHEVQVPIFSEMLSTSELAELGKEAQKEQDAILDIYAERTGTDRAVLAQLMAEQKVRTASELLEYGFIDHINSYNTNQLKRKNMKKSNKNEFVNSLDKFMKSVKNILGEPVNYDFTDADGNVILSTEREDETIEVGDAVILPDGATEGEVELADGRVIVVAEGVVTEIKEKEEGEAEAEEAPVTEEEVENMRNRIAQLENALAKCNNLLKEARNKISSNYEPAQRVVKAKAENKLTADEITAQAKSRVRK